MEQLEMGCGGRCGGDWAMDVEEDWSGKEEDYGE